MSRATSRTSPYLIAAAGVSICLWSAPAAAQSVYEEIDGIIAIEAESAQTVAGWQAHAPAVDGLRGQAMLSTGGDSICSSNTNNAKNFPPLEYHFRINTNGTYRLHFNIHKQVHCVDVNDPSQLSACHDGAKCISHGVQSDGDSCPSNRCWRNDISNDAFVKVVTANGDPVNWVGGTSDITKLFGGSGSAYAWSGNNALDHGGSKHAPDWDLPPGDYVLQVRSRSNGFSFDRLILVESGANTNSGKAAPESPIVEEPDPGTGGADAGTGGADAGTGGTDTGASGGAAAGTGGTTATTGGAAASTGGADSSGGMTDDEMKEGTGSGDDSPSTGSGDESSCTWGVSTPNNGWFIASLLLLGAAFRRRRAQLH